MVSEAFLCSTVTAWPTELWSFCWNLTHDMYRLYKITILFSKDIRLAQAVWRPHGLCYGATAKNSNFFMRKKRIETAQRSTMSTYVHEALAIVGGPVIVYFELESDSDFSKNKDLRSIGPLSARKGSQFRHATCRRIIVIFKCWILPTPSIHLARFWTGRVFPELVNLIYETYDLCMN